jgi:hypothetical protein
MSYRAMALVAASVLMLSGTALAQKKEPTTDSLNPNSSRSNVNRMGGGGGGRAGPAGLAVSDPGVPNDPVKKPKTKTK